ncbi:zinc-ribbon domain-containing protein [uncultured Megamonas sp.]|uniref:zinc-ribbon domain-containing protein n=1 Tax=uncultured Megamonas sp. TaxID=286140 RepID=UPI00259B982E|nr:zinc-ribbon domain-containing protein [uncultured Megamonas sp.]
MSRRKTTREYIEECKQKEYDLPIDEYVNARTKIKHKCSKCGYVYDQTPHNHLNGRGCPYCKGTPKLTSKKYIDRCKKLSLDLPIEEYKGRKQKIKFKCQYCGETYLQRADVHIDQEQGHRKCSFANRKKDYTIYIKECKQNNLDLPISPKEYLLNNKRALKHMCPKGHTYIQRMDLHLRGHGCPVCGGTKKRTPKDYIELCKRRGYDLPIEPYVNNRTKIKHKCNKCGFVYKQRPAVHLQGHGCPNCSKSLGERHIKIYLDKHNIPCIEQKRFTDCVYKNELPFDFYLPNQNVLIEYQGEQHYEFNKHFHKTKEVFEERKLKDRIKKEYAKNSGYTLLEPTYKLDTQDKVDKYLDKHLFKRP